MGNKKNERSENREHSAQWQSGLVSFMQITQWFLSLLCRVNFILAPDNVLSKPWKLHNCALGKACNGIRVVCIQLFCSSSWKTKQKWKSISVIEFDPRLFSWKETFFQLQLCFDMPRSFILLTWTCMYSKQTIQDNCITNIRDCLLSSANPNLYLLELTEV